jgi:hypothetical protein
MLCRRLLIFFVVVVGFASECSAGSTLYLPRLFDPSQMGTVGVAFVNPTLTAASLTFRLRNSSGATITSVPSSLPAKGQKALTLAQIFPSVSSIAWFSVDTDVDQVTGFWMFGDFVTSVDGAALLTSNNALENPALTFFNQDSEISFANIGSSTISGTVYERDANGRREVDVPFSLPPFGVFQASVASLFPVQAPRFDSAGYRISVLATGGQIIGTSVTPNAGRDNVVANFVSPNATQFLFPHVVDGAVGGAAYNTLLMLDSYQSTTVTATLTLTQASGQVLKAQGSVPPSGVFRTTLTDLFGVPSIDGWLQVDASAAISGTINYTDIVNGGSTAVEMQSHSGDTGIIFGHMAALSPWWTGIALVNSSTTAAQVEVYALDSSGRLIAGPAESPAASFVLAPQSKRAFLLNQILPQVEARSTDGGYIYVRTTNAVKIHGIELFFLRNGRVYSNVPPTRLTGLALAFSPSPATVTGTSGGSVVVEQSFLGDMSNQPITSLQPCAAVTLNMVVNNTTGRTVTVTRQYRSIGPNGYTLAMFSVSGDQAAGRSTRFTNVTVPCDAPSGTYTFTGSIDYNGTVTSSSSSFPVQSSGGGTTGGGTTGGGTTGGGTTGGGTTGGGTTGGGTTGGGTTGGGTTGGGTTGGGTTGGGTTGGGTTGGGTTGGGTTGSTCTPSDTTICVPSAENEGYACYDAWTQKSFMGGYSLMALGGSPLSGYTWTLASGSTYPRGVAAITPLTGILKGTGSVMTKGRQSFVITASDGSRTGSGTITIVVEEINTDFRGPVDPTTGNIPDLCGTDVFQQPVGPITLPNAKAGKAYGASLPVYGIRDTLTWSVSGGSLPPGMVLDQARGVVRGTPLSSAAGQTFRFRVSVRDPANVALNTPQYSITVQ